MTMKSNVNNEIYKMTLSIDLNEKKFLYIMERQIQQNREYKVIMYVCT